MTSSVQIIWSHRRVFVFVFGITFLVLSVVIFLLPKRVIVRSAVEISSAVVDGRTETFEPPDYVARRVYSIYGPAELQAMVKKGISPSVLGELQDPNVESIGRTVVISSTLDPSAEKEAKEFHEAIADRIIKDLEPRAHIFPENIANRIAVSTKAADSLEQLIKTDTNEIERISDLSDNLRGQIENQRANLERYYQLIETPPQPGHSSVVEEARIRDLQAQIASLTNLLGSLALSRSEVTQDLAKTRRLYEELRNSITDAKSEQNSFIQTHTSLSPLLMPAQKTSRQFSLMLLAFTISVLAGVGAVVLIHNMDTGRA